MFDLLIFIKIWKLKIIKVTRKKKLKKIPKKPRNIDRENLCKKLACTNKDFNEKNTTNK